MADSLPPSPACLPHGKLLSLPSQVAYTLRIGRFGYRLLNPLQANLEYYRVSVTILALHELNRFLPT